MMITPNITKTFLRHVAKKKGLNVNYCFCFPYRLNGYLSPPPPKKNYPGANNIILTSSRVPRTLLILDSYYFNKYKT